MPRSGENIYKRKDGRWEGRYIKGRKADGSIYYGYVYHRSYTEIKRKLFTYKLRYKENYLDTNKKLRSSLTFTQCALNWLTSKEDRVRPNTFQSYKSKLNNHLIPYLEGYNLSELTPDLLQGCVDYLAEHLSPNSVRSVIRVLKTCLKYSVDAGYISKNPAEGLLLPEVPVSTVQAFTKEEQAKLEQIIFCDQKSENKYFSIYLSLYSGLRIGEIAGLQWQDINWAEKTLIIQRNVQRINYSQEGTELILTQLKTKASNRVIPLTETVYKKLKNRQQQAMNSFIFPGVCGPVDPRTLRYKFAQLKKIAQVSDLPFHALRHTFATRCIEAGVSVTTLSALMGHQSTKMTLDTYTNSFLSEKRVAIAKLEK